MKSMRNLFFTAFLIAGLITTVPGSFLSRAAAREPGRGEKAAVSQEAEQWQVLATSPDVKVVSQRIISHPGVVLNTNEKPMDAAYDWLDKMGLEEGRNLLHGKLLYVSVGAAVVNAKPSDPAYIDSRYMAFQRAELQAKANTAIYLGVDLSTSRGSSDREINPEERKALMRLYNSSKTLQENAEKTGVAKTIKTLFRKSARLAEAKLDKALEKSGVDVKGEKKKRQNRARAQKTKLQRLREISDTSVKTAASAFSEVQGTQVIQSFEGSYKKNYQVVVITLWSENLQKLVDSMISGTAPYRMDKKQAKASIMKQLPADPRELACLTGVRAYINQYGENVLLAFGQAGVEVIGGREDKAFMLAEKKARLRAMGALREFMGETVAFNSTEKLQEILGLYAGEYQGDEGSQEYRSISQFSEMVRGEAAKQKIVGVYHLLDRELKHPFTDRPMVLQVMAWSPASQKLAKEVRHKIENKRRDAAGPVHDYVRPVRNVPTKKGTISSGAGADPDAW